MCFMVHVMNRQQLDLIKKHRSDLMDLIESLSADESCSNLQLLDLINIRQSYDKLIESFDSHA